MPRLRGTVVDFAIVAAVLAVAVAALIANSLDRSVAGPPSNASMATPSPSVGEPLLASPTPDVSTTTCEAAPFFFTPPPYAEFRPVPGITVRAIDKVHFEVTNATSRTYYVGVSSWDIENNLLCGRGVLAHNQPGGRVGPGKTLQGVGGSRTEAPMTVSIWAYPCGDGCSRDPIGQYVVPISSVEPPAPVST